VHGRCSRWAGGQVHVGRSGGHVGRWAGAGGQVPVGGQVQVGRCKWAGAAGGQVRWWAGAGGQVGRSGGQVPSVSGAAPFYLAPQQPQSKRKQPVRAG
jgi:hypothetical protein